MLQLVLKILILESIDKKLKLDKITLDLDIISDFIGLLIKMLFNLLRFSFCKMLPKYLTLFTIGIICLFKNKLIS